MRIWEYSAVQLAQMIRDKQVSAREVIEAHLERITEVNATVNAITIVLKESALEAADAVDAALARGETPGPLAGVPMTVKENIDLAGSATTLGVKALENVIPPEDAIHIAQLKGAGAIPIGRTNMPDFGLRWHTDNALRGATLNPWDASRTPGGSSGGDGVALALGMTALGMGNDYGGSVRIPSYCAGTVAIRPSRGRVPRIMNYNPNERVRRSVTSQLFSVHGPMARHIEDLRLALANMSAPDPRDSTHIAMPLRGEPLPTPMKVAVVENPGENAADPVVAASIRRAADTLSDAGYIVEAVEPPEISQVTDIYSRMVLADIQYLSLPVMQQLANPDALRFLNLFIQQHEPITLEETLLNHGEHNLLADDWALFMAEYPLILGPVSTQKPFMIGADIADQTSFQEIQDSLALTIVANCLGLPAVAVPVGIEDGLPQGVQIIGQPFREDLCLDAAQAIEDRLGTITPIDPNVS